MAQGGTLLDDVLAEATGPATTPTARAGVPASPKAGVDYQMTPGGAQGGKKPPSLLDDVLAEASQPSAGELLQGAAAGFGRGVAGFAEVVERGIGLAEQTFEPPLRRMLTGQHVTEAEKKRMVERGEADAKAARAFWEQTLKVPERAEEALTTKVAGAIGSTVPYATAAAIPGVNATLAIAATGVAEGLTSGYYEARAAGANEGDSWLAGMARGAVGLTEIVPLARIFERANAATGGRLLGALRTALLEGGEEAAQEMLQSGLGDAVQEAVTDEDRDILANMVEGGTVGGPAGMILSLLGSSTGSMRRANVAPPAERGAPNVSAPAAGAGPEGITAPTVGAAAPAATSPEATPEEAAAEQYERRGGERRSVPREGGRERRAERVIERLRAETQALTGEGGVLPPASRSELAPEEAPGFEDVSRDLQAEQDKARERTPAADVSPEHREVVAQFEQVNGLEPGSVKIHEPFTAGEKRGAELAKERGARVLVIDAGRKLNLPAAYARGAILLDANETDANLEKALVLHELVHVVADKRDTAGRRQPEKIKALHDRLAELDPEAFRAIKADYLKRFRGAIPAGPVVTGGKSTSTLNRPLREEEGVANYTQELVNYVDAALKDPTRFVRVLGKEGRSILTQLLDAFKEVANKFGAKLETSQKKALKAIKAELAATPLEQAVAPEVAMRAALAIRSFLDSGLSLATPETAESATQPSAEVSPTTPAAQPSTTGAPPAERVRSPARPSPTAGQLTNLAMPARRAAAISVVEEPAISESKPDRVSVSAEALTDPSIAPTLRTQGFGGLDAPRQRMVLSTMVRLAQDREILSSIVSSLPVEMVNVLRAKELSPERLFHDEAVLRDALSVVDDAAIAPGKGSGALVQIVARAAAKRARANARGPSLKGRAAARTLERGHGATPPSRAVTGGEGVSAPSTPATLTNEYDRYVREQEERYRQDIGESDSQVSFAVAYHGSPFDFDRFLSEKIGTGEHAQVYGHGLYFADDRAVAEFYRRKLSGSAARLTPEVRDALKRNDLLGFDTVGDAAGAVLSSGDWPRRFDVDAADVPAIKEWIAGVNRESGGKLYEVDLAPAEDEYLLLDKPLSEQSEKVKAAIKQAAPNATDTQTGQAIYDAIAARSSPRTASLTLRAAGIRGNKYLDQGSRAQGEGSYNYVVFDEKDVSIRAKFAVAKPDTPEFKRWFGDSKVVDESGKPLVVYHGAQRADRIGTRFVKSRATSGPMPFFTADPEIASKYSTGKADTSLEPPSDYAEWFKFKPKGGRATVDISRAWHHLSQEERATLAARLPHVTYENRDDASGPLVLGGADEYGLSSKDHWDYLIRESRGNVLDAAKEAWLSSGSLFDSEAEFMDILRIGGMPMDRVTFESPHAEHPGVIPAYLSIQNPLDAGESPPNVLDALERRSRRQRAPQQYGGDIWDKRLRDPRGWMEELRTNPATAWTSIPDWVTDTLRGLGYDGIRDTGGKMGGAKHVVWIPFEPTQIKSATGNRGTFDPSKPDIRFAVAPQRTPGVFLRTFQDRLSGLKQAQSEVEAKGALITDANDPSLAEELRAGRTKAAMERMRARYVDPIEGIMRRAKITAQEVSDFLQARHVPERNRELAKLGVTNGSGRTDAWAATQIAKVAADPRSKQFDRIARIHDRMHEEARATWVREGLETQAFVDELEAKYQAYTPLRTDVETDFLGTGTGLALTGRETKRALGRKSAADNSLAFSFTQAATTIVRAEKARADRAVLEFVKTAADPGFATIGAPQVRRGINPKTGLAGPVLDPRYQWKDNVLPVKVGGEVVPITFAEEHAPLAKALKGMNAVHLWKALDFLRRYTRWFTQWATRKNPAFPIFNVLLDVPFAAIKTFGEQGPAAAAKMLARVPGAWGTIYRAERNLDLRKPSHKLYNRWKNAGGPISSLDLDNYEDTMRKIEKSLGKGPAGFAWDTATEYLGSIADMMENGTRFATFQALVESGMSDQRAALKSKEVSVNFERKGDVGPLMNALYGFWNASVQGIDATAKALKYPRTWKLLASGAAAMALLDVLMRSMSDRDEDGELFYDKIPEHEKRRGIPIMHPDGRGYFLIPIPRGFGWFLHVGTKVGEVVSGPKSPAQAAGDLAIAAMEEFNPFGGYGPIEQGLAPTFADPIVQHLTNRNWYGKSIKPVNYGDRKAESELFYPNVNPTALSVARWLNKVTDPKDTGKGKLSISPEILEHYAQAVFSGAGRTASQVYDIADKAIRGEPIEARDVPVYGRIVKNPNPFYIDSAYRDNVRSIEERSKRLRDLEKRDAEEGTERALAFYNEYGFLIDLEQFKKDTEKDLDEMAEAGAPEEDLRKVKARFNREVLLSSERMAESQELAGARE